MRKKKSLLASKPVRSVCRMGKNARFLHYLYTDIFFTASVGPECCFCKVFSLRRCREQ